MRGRSVPAPLKQYDLTVFQTSLLLPQVDPLCQRNCLQNWKVYYAQNYVGTISYQDLTQDILVPSALDPPFVYTCI